MYDSYEQLEFVSAKENIILGYEITFNIDGQLRMIPIVIEEIDIGCGTLSNYHPVYEKDRRTWASIWSYRGAREVISRRIKELE